MKKDRYQTVEEIIADLEQLHRDLAAYYQRRADTSGEERVQMLLGYMVEREEELATMLYRTRTDREDDAMMHAWQTSAAQMNAIAALRDAAAQTSDDPVEMAQRIDGMLADYYQLLERESHIDRLSGMFNNLRQYQLQSASQMQMSMDRFQDI